jgi:hypothetical protein
MTDSVVRNPFGRGGAITLTLDQFKYGWANVLDDEDAERTRRSYRPPRPGSTPMSSTSSSIPDGGRSPPRSRERGGVVAGKRSGTLSDVDGFPRRLESLWGTCRLKTTVACTRTADFAGRSRGDDRNRAGVSFRLSTAGAGRLASPDSRRHPRRRADYRFVCPGVAELPTELPREERAQFVRLACSDPANPRYRNVRDARAPA